MPEMSQQDETWTPSKLKDFSNLVADAFKQGLINAPIHLCGGNEEKLIEIFKNIKKDDYVISTYRNSYHYLLKGGLTTKLFDEICGKSTGCCGGHGRSMHIFNKDLKFYSSAIIGATCAVAAGVALGIKLNGGDNKVWCFVGDGATDSGWFYEAVRYGFCQDLPLTYVVEDNDLAVETDVPSRWGTRTVVAMPPNVIYYQYKRQWPHVGIGERVSL